MNKDYLVEMQQEVNRSNGTIVIALKETKRALIMIYCVYGKVVKYPSFDIVTGEKRTRRYLELLDINNNVIATIREEDIDSYSFDISTDNMIIYLKEII